MVGECWSNVSSPGKVVGEWRANVSSPAKLAKMAILVSTRIRQTGEFSASTRIRQIRRRVAIAYSNVKICFVKMNEVKYTVVYLLSYLNSHIRFSMVDYIFTGV